MEPVEPQGTPPPPGPPPPRDVAGQVKPPAIALIVTATVGILLNAVNLIVTAAGRGPGYGWGPPMGPEMMDPQQQRWMQMYGGGIGIAGSSVGLILGIVVLLGALRMLRLQNWGFALTAAILAVIPCLSPCCVLGLPFGIWAIVVLSMPEVRAAFR